MNAPSIGLIEGAGSPNPVKQAFDTRTSQLQQQREAEKQGQRQDILFDQQQQDRKDNEMLKVFEYAGDGYTNEARYFAKSRGLQVPEEVFNNADFAKGLSMAGKIYGDDKVAAQKFTNAWMSTQGDINAKLAAAQAAAGGATNPEDRTLQRQIALEKWKLDNKVGDGADGGFSLSPNERRYNREGKLIAEAPAEANTDKTKFVQEALASALSNPLATPEMAQEAATNAAKLYDQIVLQTSGGTAPAGGTTLPTMQQKVSAPHAVHAVQQAMMEGYTPEQIKATLIQKGISEEQAISLLSSAGVR